MTQTQSTTLQPLGPEIDAVRVEAAARDTLRCEIQGLEALHDAVGAAFVAAVQTFLRVTGRIVVTGMGKSGHVGCKIAATLASTGTPSFFVHPGEASHGDLGMIARDDAVLALSNSGETAELSDIIAYTRRFQIPLVAITGGQHSTLARNSDVVLALPDAPEACPHGLAPTTSTTATLALGDAIAVAMLEQRGFTADEFRLFHPGGKLGQRLLRVADLMHTGDEIPLCPQATPMHEALVVMTGRRFGCVGALDAAGCLVGVITDGDLRRHMGPDLLEQAVAAVMTPSPITVAPDLLAASALEIMNRRAITALFVTDSDKAIGIVHIHDLLRAGVV
jgi:arabinose-5-phosphate isomerase